MIKNETILSAIYMIQDYSKGSHFLEETVDRVLDELKLLDKELEALQQPKNNCDTCKWDDYCGTEENCLSSKYIKDRYEPKLKEQ